LKNPATFAKAEDHIRKTLAYNPKDARAYHNLATLLGRQQRFEDAVANYKKALEIDPKFSIAQLNMAKVLLQLKRTEEALPALRSYLAANPLDEESRRVLAEALRDLGRKEEAIKEYEAIEELRPGEVGFKMELAALNIGLGKQRNAVGLYETILEKHPADLNALREAGRSYGEMKMTLRAIFCWQRVLSLKANDLEAQSKLAALYRDIGDENAALQKYEAVGNAGDADAWKMVAFLRDKRHERDQAMQALREAIKIKNQDVEARRTLVSMLLSDPQGPGGEAKDEALKLCKDMLMLDPKDNRARLNLANLLTDQNRLAEAQDEYEAILKLDAANGPANLGLGVVLRKRGRYQEALELYNKTLAADPKSVVAHYNVGLIYDFYFKDPVQAKAHYAKYLELGGDPKKIPAPPPAPTKDAPKETTSK
jgi:superkiller protein 3